MALHEPTIIKTGFYEKFLKPAGIDDIEDIRAMPKRTFFAEYMRQAAQLGGGAG